METIKEASQQGKTCLLTLPRCDFELSSKDESLLLLQLPVGWSPSDLKDSLFVVPAPSHDSQEKAQAALISDHKQTSFHVQRVETSNCLIMVPPPSETADDKDTTVMTESATNTSDSQKRAKVIRSVTSRLLTRGGTGASFLELRPKALSKSSIESFFLQHKLVFNPLQHENHSQSTGQKNLGDHHCSLVRGITMADLAKQLQISESQVAQALAPSCNQHPCFYPLPNTHPSAFILLSEEALLEAYQAILAALSETAELADYARGVSSSLLIQSALDRFTMDGYNFGEGKRRESLKCLPGGVRGLLSFCAGRLVRTSDTDDATVCKEDDKVCLDVSKVAIQVVRHLFQKQAFPWEESLLLARWQADLPGVGENYQVATSMLHGIAVSVVSDDGGEIFWKYLPVDAVPGDAATGFAELFSLKEKWRLEELQPYLDRWSDATGSTGAALLLQFTKSITEDQNGQSTKVFISKR